MNGDQRRNKQDDMDELEEHEEQKERLPSSTSEIDFTTVDSYTGEPLPPEPEGDIPLDDMEVSSFSDETDFIPLDDELAADYLLINSAADRDPMRDQIDDYTDDQDIMDDFAERQELTAGSDELLEKLLDHHSQGPQLSGGDIDAAWDSSVVSGEESVGGTVATPDQDIVDELGEAVGISYEDDEELNTEDKLGERDRNRWELDPRSADVEEEFEGRDDDEFNHQQELDDF